MEILEIYNNYSSLGICSRLITEGEEFDMVKKFIDFKKESFKATSLKNLAVFIEAKINDAYPDVIFAEYNPSNYEHWNSSRNSLSTTDLKLLHFIYNRRNVTSQRLIKELSIQYKTLLLSLEALLDAGLILRKGGYWIIPNRSEVFGVKYIEAVEAKISKWDVVIQQAIINKAFASESFVLSKRRREPDSEIIRRMGAFGIGIYLYDNGQFSCFARALRNRFPSNYNSIYLNECIGRIINN